MAALLACFVIAGVLRRRGVLTPEGSRKLVHIGMGVTALCFPLLFESPWPLVGLATVIAIGLIGVRVVPLLRREIGFVTLDIDRRSYGELAFVLGVTLLFVFAYATPTVFEAPVAVLTFADPLATIVGRRFGRHRFVVFGGTKSLEGSLTFFVVALACIAVVLLAGQQPLGIGVVLVSAILTGVEIVAPAGLDNLAIPLVGGLLAALL